jgi:twitching motility protein PilT
MEELLRILSEKKGSDLHVKVGNVPHVRIDGCLTPIGSNILTKQETTAMARSIMNESQIKEFEKYRGVDFAIPGKNTERFRVNIYQEKGNIGIVIRRVSLEHPTIEELNLPPIVKQLADLKRGLVLVTGTAGSGKTTTLAAMIHHINSTRAENIITVEDPIEILHPDIKSLISQRELGIDTTTYESALKQVVRQDPDVIFIGEIRDRETIDSAMKSAELGNLVFSTIHTIDATETVHRVIDLYPPHQQNLVRIMLASSLAGIISLRLLPKKGGGIVPAVEVLVVTETVKQCILKPEETYLIKKAMEEGDYYGMQTFEKCLINLIGKDLIDKEKAKEAVSNIHDFELMLSQTEMSSDSANEPMPAT